MPFQISLLLYRFGLWMYLQAIRIFALSGSAKAQRWLNGRDGLIELVKSRQQGKPGCIWFHCASLGEFEQGRPLIELIRKERPDERIILTFFSPSGYNQRKNYAEVDEVYYLPIDNAYNATEFLAAIRPRAAFFIKYEFWYYYFTELKRLQIPLFMVASVFTQRQLFFRWYGTLHRQMLSCVSHFFVQDNDSFALLRKAGFENVTVINDTRIDRVFGLSQIELHIPSIESFLSGETAFIGGSIYRRENEMIRAAADNGLLKGKIILVPHNVDEKNIRAIAMPWTDEAILYTDWLQKPDPSRHVLIVNTIGLLSATYRYAYAAFIGGGFGSGIHNTLEPAAFAIPVIVGPRHRQFPEVRAMMDRGGAFEVHRPEDFFEVMKKISDPVFLDHAGAENKAFIQGHTGGTLAVWKAVEGTIPTA
jgi:3-deoxy-D-manno-octulosonic-acid transferase